ncbi:MAG TPA: zf-HC2 domain-containing protein [Vicinamibacterales bacterium]|nr:zf-HC2 domain-containing protein [Vicinamibacterales bacterium]
MKNCQDVEPLMAPYVDGEAAPPDRAAVEAHIGACDCCRDLVATERAAREVLLARRGDLRRCAPQALHARCAAHAAWMRGRRAVPAVIRWLPLSVAATLVIAVAGVFGLGLNHRVQAVAFQVTLDHVACKRFGHASTPIDGTSAEQRWLATHGWPVRVPASSAGSDLELRAVRRCAITDGRLAHLMYRWRGEPLSIYVLPDRAADASAERVERFSHDSIVWSQNGRTYVIVAQAPRRPDLDSVVQYVKDNVY